MLVKDKQRSVDEADIIACELLILLSAKVKNFECENEPAEILYLIAHVAGNFFSRINIFLSGAGETYGIDLTKKSFDWILEITKEYLLLNKKMG